MKPAELIEQIGRAQNAYHMAMSAGEQGPEIVALVEGTHYLRPDEAPQDGKCEIVCLVMRGGQDFVYEPSVAVPRPVETYVRLHQHDQDACV